MQQSDNGKSCLDEVASVDDDLFSAPFPRPPPRTHSMASFRHQSKGSPAADYFSIPCSDSDYSGPKTPQSRASMSKTTELLSPMRDPGDYLKPLLLGSPLITSTQSRWSSGSESDTPLKRTKSFSVGRILRRRSNDENVPRESSIVTTKRLLVHGLTSLRKKASPQIRTAPLEQAAAPIRDVNTDAKTEMPRADVHMDSCMSKPSRIWKTRRVHHNSFTEFGLQWATRSSFTALAPMSQDRADADHGSDTDEYGSSDGGRGDGGHSRGGIGGSSSGGNGGKRPDRNHTDESSDDDQPNIRDSSSDDSADDYGQIDTSDSLSDSSDDRPLAQLVDDPEALQRALRSKERARRLTRTQQAIAAAAVAPQAGPSSAFDVSKLSQRLAQVQRQSERRARRQGRIDISGSHTAPAVNGVAAPKQRSRSATAQGSSSQPPVRAQKTLQIHPSQPHQPLINLQSLSPRLPHHTHQSTNQPQPQQPSRSKSVRQPERPRMLVRTPSETALRSKAMAQPLSPTAMMPRDAMAAVVAAQKALAQAQAHAASIARAQAFALTTTAALQPTTTALQPASDGPTDGATTPDGRPPISSRTSSRSAATEEVVRSPDHSVFTHVPKQERRHEAVDALMGLKVHILSQQRATMAHVPVSARALDLVLFVVEQEHLPMDELRGGWVVFDCCPTLGIERPLRSYEAVSEVLNKRTDRLDYFLLKHTELAPDLSAQSVLNTTGDLAGWVYLRQGKKWVKRWLELRGNMLWHAKNEKGKDGVVLCHLSSFDIYLVDASVKLPKAAGFAVRSQDARTMFEREEDYVHYFSLSDASAQRAWVRAILAERSRVLRGG